MENEYMTIRLVQEKSKVPAPTIYVYEDYPENSVGVPFMFMECFNGNAGIKMCQDIPPEHKLSIYTALAEAQVEIYNIELPQFGSIVGKNEDGTYQIGPAPGVGGPFDTTAEYYKACSIHEKFGSTRDQLRAASLNLADEIEASVDAFKPLLGEKAEYISVNNTGPFRMCHGRFGHAKTVFDDKFHLLGVLDWKAAFAAPCELAALFALCLTVVPPAMDVPWNYDESGCPVDAVLKERFADREHYIAIVKQIEEEKGFTSGHRLSTALEDTQRQHIANAMRLYEEGKAGFYSKVLEGFAEDN
ncbi:hypothetical protein BO94DRAFT_586111 [Aspergillus sclerotioniger CBS 115572]|uniref:Aminoglycoside phosphotransferase domain-containing protein n=1 Tax=Aspergillus sclerotioniger CBS 115572 TaxID=1450535 RepID=A0A317WJ98_9EURO|nr:hypothetical protein BO94DRAFT_586111 [Aspergillus sclerotioniger CBS 115572]PWY86526.1 hypothetical protein BO94DRAFT_586111 [Aspergillus sclerotioniger CBS 115572]